MNQPTNKISATTPMLPSERRSSPRESIEPGIVAGRPPVRAHPAAVYRRIIRSLAQVLVLRYSDAMRIDVFTLFPAMFDGPLTESILKRAQESGLLSVQLHNIRDYAAGKHKVT